MSLTNDNGVGTTMLVGPTNAMPYPVYSGNNDGGFGDNGWWIILLLLLACNGGWGGGFGGFGGGGEIYPWMNQANLTSNGFQNQMLNDNITSIRDGISDISTQLCNGFNGVTNAVNVAQNAVAQQLYTNQIADLERSFAAQTANTQGMTALQSQLAQCCCDNRLATNDLKYTIATENCADRAALSDGLRDVLTATQAQTQRILDQLCQDKIDAKNDEISALRQQIAMKDLAASQVAQNAFIAQGFSNEVDQLYNRLNSCPVPTTPVYGRTPIFTCNQNQGCGCGCGNGNF